MRSAISAGNGPYGLPLMKFSLTFDGELPSTGNSGSKKSEKKWAIRSHLAPQLDELWRVTPALNRLSKGYFVQRGANFIVTDTHHEIGRSDAPFAGIQNRVNIYAPIEKFGMQFQPLVRNSFALICSLDILFLRKEKPGRVYQGGDIDGRIKTLLDALSMPQHQEQMKGAPDAGSIMRCLLEDDSLITGIKVNTERLLTSEDVSEHTARLIIGVDVRVSDSRSYNTLFLGD